jgi:nucleotidyltransferase substrate binding protein (TIGR01987 family)
MVAAFNRRGIIRMTPQTADEKPRWVYRFDNYTRALTLLREGIETMQARHLNDLEKQGLIQRFEFTCELAWKLLKDYLEDTAVRLETVTPAAVIKEAFAARLIENGDLWMQSLNARNRTSHIYDLKTFEKILADIGHDYLPLFEALQRKLLPSTLED